VRLIAGGRLARAGCVRHYSRRGSDEQTGGGDGFADSFPVAALTEVLKARLARPSLCKADWVEIGAAGRS
jgi:hypothetical protein